MTVPRHCGYLVWMDEEPEMEEDWTLTTTPEQDYAFPQMHVPTTGGTDYLKFHDPFCDSAGNELCWICGRLRGSSVERCHGHYTEVNTMLNVAKALGFDTEKAAALVIDEKALVDALFVRLRELLATGISIDGTFAGVEVHATIKAA